MLCTLLSRPGSVREECAGRCRAARAVLVAWGAAAHRQPQADQLTSKLPWSMPLRLRCPAGMLCRAVRLHGARQA